MCASCRRCRALPANCRSRGGPPGEHLIFKLKRLFTGEVFTQNSDLLRTSE